MMLEEASEMEFDLPPEYCRYRDDGCDLADSYLHCPFPKCVYEEDGGRQHWLKKSRDLEVARQFYAEGKGIKELAGETGKLTVELRNDIGQYASPGEGGAIGS